MLARVTINARGATALLVPQEALVFDTNQYFVFVALGDNRFERRAITIESWQETGFVHVLSGLRAGERIVASESLQVAALWHQANGETF